MRFVDWFHANQVKVFVGVFLLLALARACS